MQSKQHIFLTGFMGSGKTSNGKKLAKLMRLNFVDLDYYIEQKEKISIHSLFDNFGETIFRKIEQRCLNEVMADNRSSVISLGGGTICFEDNLQNIKNNGILIYLDLPPLTLQQRLEVSKVKRPLIEKLKGQQLLNFINFKLAERLPFYDSAHLKISGLNLTPQLLLQKISEYKA